MLYETPRKASITRTLDPVTQTGEENEKRTEKKNYQQRPVGAFGRGATRRLDGCRRKPVPQGVDARQVQGVTGNVDCQVRQTAGHGEGCDQRETVLGAGIKLSLPQEGDQEPDQRQPE